MFVGQEQTLHMINHPDEQNSEGLGIRELHGHYMTKKIDARSALDKYNRYVHMDYPIKVAEPVLRLALCRPIYCFSDLFFLFFF